jgi:formylmethanofuran dehydrogenase subunit D
MISGRTLTQGASCERKMSPDFSKAVSICYLSEQDYTSLELSSGRNVLLKNEFGQVVLTAHQDAGLPSGIIFIPMGPWSNALVGPDTGGCGTPQFKGVEIELESTDAPVMDIRDLFRSMGREEA